MPYSLTMTLDDRFDALIESLAGFHRTWIIALGLELGLLDRIRSAGREGIGPGPLAEACGCSADPVRAWALAAFAHDVVDFDGERLTLDEDDAAMLLGEDRPEYLGGQFVHAVVASLDHDRLAEVVRTGRPATDRPDRYRRSIERLTRQDIAVFFQETLAALPDLVARLAQGARVVDLHCGGGRWLIALARRFPETSLLGVEFESDSVERARANVAAAGLTDRVEIVEAGIPEIDESVGAFDLAYFQYALHQLRDASASVRAGWTALRPGGQLVVQDWCMPEDLEEYRTQHGRLMAGVQLDEVFQGTRLLTVTEFLEIFRDAGLPDPAIVDLPSGATVFLVRRSGG